MSSQGKSGADKVAQTANDASKASHKAEAKNLKEQTKKDVSKVGDDVAKGADLAKKQGKEAVADAKKSGEDALANAKKSGEEALASAKKQGQEAYDEASAKLEEAYHEMKIKYEELKKQGGQAFEDFKKEFEQFEADYKKKVDNACAKASQSIKSFDTNYLNGNGSKLLASIDSLLQRTWHELHNPVVIVQGLVSAVGLAGAYVSYRDRHRINLDNPFVVGTHAAIITGLVLADKYVFDKFYPKYDTPRVQK